MGLSGLLPVLGLERGLRLGLSCSVPDTDEYLVWCGSGRPDRRRGRARSLSLSPQMREISFVTATGSRADTARSLSRRWASSIHLIHGDLYLGHGIVSAENQRAPRVRAIVGWLGCRRIWGPWWGGGLGESRGEIKVLYAAEGWGSQWALIMALSSRSLKPERGLYFLVVQPSPGPKG